ncbi:hypothetical protein D3C77_122430 [compost metagenome]
MQIPQLVPFRPLVIYLDSSDFSNLSNPEGNQEKKNGIKNKLKSWIDAGQVEIRYSMTHIMEALPTQESAMELGRLRLSCIQELCGSKVFVDQITLITNELSLPENQEVLNDDGCWFPLSSILGEFAKESGETKMLNRKERRLLAAEMRKSRSDLSFSSEQEEMSAQFPFKRDKAAKVLKNPNNPDVFQAALTESLKDLSHLFTWHEEHWDLKTEFSSILREFGGGISNIFIDAAQEISGFYAELEMLGESEQVVDQKIKNFVKAISDDAPQDLANSLREDLAPNAPPVVIGKDNTPAIFVLSKLLMHNIKSSVIPRQRPRIPKASDLGDVMHALYLPYVDFFRADAATAHIINSQDFGFRAVVVTSLEKLVDAVGNRLNE